MEIDFETDTLRQLCENCREADRQLGRANAKKLRARLADLEAVDCVAEIVAGRPHPLTGDRKGEFALSLSGGCRLVFRPRKLPPPSKEDGGIDWAAVDEICVTYIGDYHE